MVGKVMVEKAMVAARLTGCHPETARRAGNERPRLKWELERDLQKRRAADGSAGIIGGGRPKDALVAMRAVQDLDDEI